MKEKVVAGNWKMHGTRVSVDALTHHLVEAGSTGCEVLVCPPHVFLDQVGRLVQGTGLKLCGQNIDWHEEGAYTGEISASMLEEAGCEYCLVGHSERRSNYGETDEIVAKKFAACLKHGLVPILCIGETLTERQAGETKTVVVRQVSAVTDKCGIDALAEAIIAYEPVWAIGTGESATPDQAEEVHRQVRAFIADEATNIAENMRILYGGSVNARNAAGLFAKENIDGALVGGASLKAEEFVAICNAAG
ncbi:MAG: triose-phosphate isomerase [Pseudomonadales bacterium]